jgi:hypothetical protein
LYAKQDLEVYIYIGLTRSDQFKVLIYHLATVIGIGAGLDQFPLTRTSGSPLPAQIFQERIEARFRNKTSRL